MSITSDLITINTIKQDIKTTIQDKGVAVTGAFNTYASKISEIDTDVWVRPTDWLAIPAFTPNEQKVCILVGIKENFINKTAFAVNGNYTVDWGDGSTENINGGTKAEHTYNYSAISSETITTEGFKQCLITITPQSGQNLTNLDLNQTPTGLGSNYKMFTLDIQISAPNLTSINLVSRIYCKRISFLSNTSLTTCSSLFDGCFSLEKVEMFNTSSITDFSNMYKNCYSLKYPPQIDTSLATTLASLHEQNNAIKKTPSYVTTNVTNFSGMVRNCYVLKEVNISSFSKATTLENFSVFGSINGLLNINATELLTLNSAFSGGSSKLTEANFSNMTKLTSAISAFANCSLVQKITGLNLNSVTLDANVVNMFQNCYNLTILDITNIGVTISFANCNLSRSQLVTIFNNLKTVNKTITITNNPGAAELTANDKLIATNKGWTIVG